MAWDFSTDPEYQRKLDWARDFVRTQKDRPLAGVRVVLTRPKEVGLRDPQRTAPRQFGRTELARCTRGDGFVVPLSRRERYHHGDLRRARVEAALDIAREQDARPDLAARGAASTAAFRVAKNGGKKPSEQSSGSAVQARIAGPVPPQPRIIASLADLGPD